MKRAALLLASLLIAIPASQAGSFGGPPPFSNGSALVSGVDGSYQASARGQNLSGVFRFQYANGTQTSSSTGNDWIFFVQGQIQRGSVTAAIDGGSVSGVLDTLSGTTGTNSNGTIQLPIVFLNANNSSSGSFGGKIKGNGSFNGTGELQPAPGSTNQVVAISQTSTDSVIIIASNAIAPGSILITNAVFTNLPGTIVPTQFRYSGVRLTTTATTGTNSSSTSTSTTTN